ncbi:MAG: flagellar protein FliT [Lachnospiraceae bacterium]|jgi:flagellar biosynthesis/type III secretory pathway chaperone|nr:flagellar protein FliT [Lachnospiraceae bacterium]
MIELAILEDSLIKKKGILVQITEANQEQEKALSQEPVSYDDFEVVVDRKAILIEELVKLDQGFESVYDRIKDTLLANREQHKEKIASFKALISDITELSVSIQAQEVRNKALVENALKQSRKDIKSDRVRAKAAYDFMNRMGSPAEVPARFLDTRS